jgi:DNA mismatch repair protein MSH6
MKKPSDPDYNHSTLHISPEDFNSLTDGMKRYWEIKKFNMDKILLYRFGDWYVVYFDDLTICSKIMELIITPHPGQA